MSHESVLRYLELFTEGCGIQTFIKCNQSVRRVSKLDNGSWRVQIDRLCPDGGNNGEIRIDSVDEVSFRSP